MPTSLRAAVLAAVSFGTSANAAKVTTTSTVLIHSGIVGRRVIGNTGDVTVSAVFNSDNDTVGNGVIAELRYGTGASPVSGDAASGTGIFVNSAINDADTATRATRLTIIGRVPAGTLVAGTDYWFTFLWRAAVGGIAGRQNEQIVGVEH